MSERNEEEEEEISDLQEVQLCSSNLEISLTKEHETKQDLQSSILETSDQEKNLSFQGCRPLTRVRSLVSRLEKSSSSSQDVRITPTRAEPFCIKTWCIRKPTPEIAELQKKIRYTPIDVYYPRPIPEPDYSDTEDSGDISPRKFYNPCLESLERQQLHRELLWYKKMGIDILRPKTELKSVVEAVRCKRKKLKEIPKSIPTELEMKLEERKKKLEALEGQEEQIQRREQDLPEFVRVRSRIFSYLDQDVNSDEDTASDS